MRILTLVAAAFAFAAPAFAVQVKHCPKLLKFEISNLKVFENIETKLRDKLWEEDEVQNALAVINHFFERKSHSDKLTLIEADKAICRYAAYGTSTRAKFYTKDGRDTLRLALPSSDKRDFGLYVNILGYSVEGLDTSGSAGVTFEVTVHNHKYTEFEETVNVGKGFVELK